VRNRTQTVHRSAGEHQIADLFGLFERTKGGPSFFANDLGMITEEVPILRDCYELPGMHVLHIGSDESESPHSRYNCHQLNELATAESASAYRCRQPRIFQARVDIARIMQ
jgi:4-alpha-glucanotransferase